MPVEFLRSRASRGTFVPLDKGSCEKLNRDNPNGPPDPKTRAERAFREFLHLRPGRTSFVPLAKGDKCDGSDQRSGPASVADRAFHVGGAGAPAHADCPEDPILNSSQRQGKQPDQRSALGKALALPGYSIPIPSKYPPVLWLL